jgi:Rad3-related DNA helicase
VSTESRPVFDERRRPAVEVAMEMAPVAPLIERAEVVVCDYNPVFSDGSALLRRTARKRKSVVIVDEAHNLPQRLMDDRSGTLAAADLERPMALSSLRGHREDLGVWETVRKLTAGSPPSIGRVSWMTH